MAVFTKNRVALCLAALMLMANLLYSQGGYVGCFAPHQNCFPDDCQKKCEEGLGKDVTGSCELDKILNPYSQFACCCTRKSVSGADKHD